MGVRGREAEGGGLTLPGPSAMAATWDGDLVRELGVALGVESLDKDVDVLLAPTVNVQRSPRGGRHFEMFSEDPELSSRMAVAYISGVQSQGVGACIKHFVGNEQEHERTTIDTLIDQRTLREIYLRPFEAAVHEANVRAVMAAYNYVNGHHACSHAALLDEVLKREWGFDGVVMSDWNAVKETAAPARNGLDLEMPGPGRWWGDGKLEAAVRSGTVDVEAIDDKVRRILGLLSWRARLPGKTTTSEERDVDRPEHRALARRAAADGMVLLRNDGILPLDRTGSVALIGHGAASTALQGGGSAHLRPRHSSTVLDAFTARWTGDVGHAPGVDLSRSAPTLPREWIGPDGVSAELFEGFGFDGEPFEVQHLTRVRNYWFGDNFPSGISELSVRLRFTLTSDVSGTYRFVGAGFGATRLIVDGVVVSDNRDHSFPAGLGLTGSGGTVHLEAGQPREVVLEQEPKPDERPVALTDIQVARADENLEEGLLDAERAAADADVAVVVVGSNSEWESEGMDRPDLVLPAGQDELVRRVLTANPRTVVVLNCGAPMELPWLDDAPATVLAWYPGQEGGDAIFDVLVGDAEPAGRMPTTWPRREQDTPSFSHYPGTDGVVEYGERFHVGHRWYHREGIEPLVPFGHGGSYTSFEWGAPSIEGEGADVTVEVPVQNVGARPGAEVVQVYVEPADPSEDRATRVLGGFAKVRPEPGETCRARIELGSSAFARWDIDARGWAVDPGPYDLVVAASATDERHRLAHVIDQA